MFYRTQEILSRWTEYCTESYNHESYADKTVLDCSQHPVEDLQKIFREEVEIAVAALKKRSLSAGNDNISVEFVQAGGKTMIDVLTKICNKIWNGRTHGISL